MQNINLFEMLNLKKNKIKNLLEVAYKEGFLTQEDLMKNIDKIENDKLTIGVIGQMKSGKSTFLNAFVFENDVLPTATTPMTAALTVISYGEKEKIRWFKDKDKSWIRYRDSEVTYKIRIYHNRLKE